MRIAVLPDGLAILAETLHIERASRSTTAPVGPANPYFPVGALAVDPTGERAWTRAPDGRAARVDLRSGATKVFDFPLRDAVYDPSGTVVAVLGDDSNSLSLVEFHDDAPTEHTPLPLPEPRRIHWPFGQPYRFAAYGLDWDGELRLSATRHGVALAHVNGTLWARFADGHQGAWGMPPVYQGWTCAYPHAEGLLVTSVHNGRTGDFVWLDRHGVWHDGFDSNWQPVSPCLPTTRGFVATVGDDLVRLEGFPAVITERIHLGRWPQDAAVDHDLRRVMVVMDGCRAEMSAKGGPVRVHRQGEMDREAWEHVAEPGAVVPWHLEAVDDPDLGRIWRPSAERVAALVAELHLLHAREPQAAVEHAKQVLRQDALEVDTTPAQIEPAVWRALQRWVSPDLTRPTLLRIIERLAHAPDDPFLEHALRASVPAPWRDLSRPTLPAAEWIQAQVPRLHGGQAGQQRVVHARITASPRQRPPWSIVADLDDGTTLCVTLDRFDPAALVAPPSEVSEDIDMFRGMLHRDGAEPQPVVVELDPWPEPIAYRVTVTANKGGGIPLRTGAQFEPVVLADPDDARVLAYGSETWPRLFLGRYQGQTALSPVADDLEDPRLLPQPTPRPRYRVLLEALVAEELLELTEPIGDALTWAVEVALGTAASAVAATQALEDLLLDHPVVDELFADPEQLIRYVAPFWPETTGA